MTRRTAVAAVLIGALLVLPGAVARADTDVKASNQSEGTETQSGDATATNNGSAQVGLDGGGGSTQVGDSSADQAQGSDIQNGNATNVQEGDNDLEASQDAQADSGNTVGGQVIGVITDGVLTADATNLSSDVDNQSGDATTANNFDAFVGLLSATQTAIGADDDIVNGNATNVQAGDDTIDLFQNGDAGTGDAVGGQIFGARSGGPADIVLSNTSDDAASESGEADEDNDASTGNGLAASGQIETT